MSPLPTCARSLLPDASGLQLRLVAYAADDAAQSVLRPLGPDDQPGLDVGFARRVLDARQAEALPLGRREATRCPDRLLRDLKRTPRDS